MTSKNSSLIDSGKFQKLLFRRRLWPAAMTGLIFFIYHILAPGLILNPNSHFNAFGIAADSQGLSLPQQYALDIFSDEGAFYLLITTGIAIVLAIQGFAWLDSRRQLDFYESQPFSRRQRFFGTVLNSFLIYAGCYLATLVPGLLIAAGNGAMSAHLPAGAFRRFGLALSLFAGVYGISVLAALLTGTVIFAVLGTFILLSAEAAYRILFSSYSQTFLTTWSTQWFTGKTFTMPFSWYTEDKFLPNLLIAAATLLLSWISFRLRKSESAGTTVVFAPVRLLVKTGIVLYVSLLAGLFGANLFSSSEFAAPVILILFFTALCCCIMEIIYAMSFRDLFRHPVQIAVYSAAALAIFLGFRLDLCGVNRYVPDASRVESCALLFEQNDYNNSFYVPETGGVSYDMQQYLEKNTMLSDVPAVLDLTRRGIAETVEDADRDEDTGAFSRRINVEVLFRYKNGRKTWRKFQVDAVQDAALLDAAFSTTDYKDAEATGMEEREMAPTARASAGMRRRLPSRIIFTYPKRSPSGPPSRVQRMPASARKETVEPPTAAEVPSAYTQKSGRKLLIPVWQADRRTMKRVSFEKAGQLLRAGEAAPERAAEEFRAAVCRTLSGTRMSLPLKKRRAVPMTAATAP